MKCILVLCVVTILTIPMGYIHLNKQKMRHLKSIEEFKKVNEQLFKSEGSFFNKMLNLGDTKNDATASAGGADSSGSSSGSSGTIDNKVDISDYGKFSEAKDKKAPLVVVYGGIDVAGKKSGVYMYDYLNTLGNSVNLFVAKDASINGKSAYTSLKNKLSDLSITPSKKILYLFSGGWSPGKDLLSSVSASEFDTIYLVDIWMGKDASSSFYKKLAADNRSKVKYFYTSFGANDKSASDAIIKAVNTSKLNGNNDHMSTNTDAVSDLKGII